MVTDFQGIRCIITDIAIFENCLRSAVIKVYRYWYKNTTEKMCQWLWSVGHRKNRGTENAVVRYGKSTSYYNGSIYGSN